MNNRHPVFLFLLKEWLLLAAVAGLLMTSLYRHRIPTYTRDEIIPIFLLLALFVSVKGIENSGLLVRLGARLEEGRFLATKMIGITYILSAIVTIDVSLVTMIPLALSLNIRHRDRLVLLVALTAHTGSALMPFGTPQNLFIFSFYHAAPWNFMETIAPFSFGMLLFFLFASFFVDTAQTKGPTVPNTPSKPRETMVYGALLALVVLCVLRVLPSAWALLAIGYPLLFDRRALEVDYPLLITFLCFIGLSGNIADILSAELQHPHHVFVLSSLLSQFISNVPTTLLLTKFTSQWEALLWGSNVGGFGSLVAAMANLITYRLYTSHPNGRNDLSFALKFILAGYAAFFLGMGLYYVSRAAPFYGPAG